MGLRITYAEAIFACYFNFEKTFKKCFSCEKGGNRVAISEIALESAEKINRLLLEVKLYYTIDEKLVQIHRVVALDRPTPTLVLYLQSTPTIRVIMVDATTFRPQDYQGTYVY